MAILLTDILPSLDELKVLDDPCCYVMTIGSRKSARRGKGSRTVSPGHRSICGLPATKILEGKPYCEHHAPSAWRMDPFYTTKEWRSLWRKTCERDKWICQYCGEKGYQADHIVPRGAGGPDALPNLVCACKICNQIAGGRQFKTFDQKKSYVLKAQNQL